ncbi:AAA family ATPase [Sinimarinibacterium sp. NLF-5-8]|uniref:AAA family ATPase n=1 Tax=Sinimarinibacterium sp. NLF-5-8 TaxID=2698684 RepID=UPI00137BF13D|nr:AAA family ATPase [Sinimarinibacterium sp. NLF-5-8]QHS10134.1 AAA family ATPase [Sinimarinibacterium sp. NLF-5-8]
MYTEFFQLREMPFSITPDPAYLYLSSRHQEALGHLLYGTGQYGGFVQLTGEVGTGKTTIIRSLLEQRLPEVDVAVIHNPRQSEHEFVHSLCDELGVAYPREQPSLKTLVDALNTHLLKTHAAGRRTVLIIDEAQNLQPGVLEQVRLLTNLETAKEKLLRIMLIGQPELSVLLARPELRQLASRITARYHLTALTEAETAEYILHRLRVAGAQSAIFELSALARVHRHTQGNPRLINVVCDRALMGAYGRHARRITPAIVDQATREVMGDHPLLFDPRADHRWRTIERVWLLLLVISIGVFAYSYWWPRAQQIPSTAEPAHPPVAVAADSPADTTDEVPVFVPADDAPKDSPALQRAALPVSSVADLPRTIQPLPMTLLRLARLWNARLPKTDTEGFCGALQKQGLECYRSNGAWDDLLKMNRPAILTLDLREAGQHYFLLESMGSQYAIVDTALGPMRLPLEQLRPLWTGEFLLLWRRQTHALKLDASANAADIAWLHEQLVDLGYITDARAPRQLTPALQNAVRRLQGDRGLATDGIAGVRTLIELGDDVAETPKLSVDLP